MKLHELAAELDQRTPVVLQACTDLGIEATWAGSEVSDGDAARIREALGAPVAVGAPAPSSTSDGAAEAPVVSDPAPADEPTAATPAATPEATSDEDPAPAAAEPAPAVPVAAAAAAAAATAATPATPVAGPPPSPPSAPPSAPVVESPGTVPPPLLAPPGIASPGEAPPGELIQTQHKRVLDYNVTDAMKSIFFGLVFGGVGVVCLIHADSWNDWKLSIPGAAGYLFGAIFLVIAIIESAKAITSVRALPSRRKGIPWAILTMVIAVGLLAPGGVSGWNQWKQRKKEYDADQALDKIKAKIPKNATGYRAVIDNALHTAQNGKTGDAVLDARSGACFSVRLLDRVGTDQALVACTQPHNSEKVGSVLMSSDPTATYPSTADQQKLAAPCAAFADAYTKVLYKVIWTVPTEDMWNRNLRVAACQILNPAGTWTTSVRGH